MTRYVIIGAGAVGITLAAELQAAGRDVVVVGRGRQLDLLRDGAVRYLTPDGSRLLSVAAAGHADEVRLDPRDILVLATKTQDAHGVLAQWSRQPVGTGGQRAGEVLPVFTLQNGLDAERAALRLFATVVGSVLGVPSTYVADGEVLSPGAPAVGVFWLGSYPDGPAGAAAQTIAADLAAARFEVQVVTDLSRWKAAKLVMSSAFVLDALFEPGPGRDRAARLAQAEARAVLEAAGWSIADTAAESTLRPDRFGIAPVPGHARPGSSTYQSLARGKDVETDYLNGEIVLLARKLGRRAPLHAALQARAQRVVQEGGAPGRLTAADLAETLAQTVVVDAATLATELRSSRPPALLDVRWALGDPDGEKQYLDGHLPDAVYVNLDEELASPPSPEAGRHPLPDINDLQRAARRWGLAAHQPVVVYDDNGGLSAARAWWLLRWAGHTDARILDGGLGAWRAAGEPVATGAYRLEAGDITLTAGGLPTVDVDTAASLARTGVLLDARAGERYRGETEPIDPRAGHIPGALSRPAGDNLGPNGRFRPAAELQARLSDLPADATVGVYCGSGVTAAHEIAALQIAGIDAVLFPGSWSAWSADPDRPIATGSQPG
jgi:thiosulfate/3-mercaptopyruvate sulfurtransferase